MWRSRGQPALPAQMSVTSLQYHSLSGSLGPLSIALTSAGKKRDPGDSFRGEKWNPDDSWLRGILKRSQPWNSPEETGNFNK